MNKNPTFSHFLPFLLLFLAIYSCSKVTPIKDISAVPEASIISLSQFQQDKFLDIVIEGNRPLTYTAFKLTDPLRIAIDIPETSISQGINRLIIDKRPVMEVIPTPFQGNIKGTRMEVTLSENADYQIYTADNKVILRFSIPETKNAEIAENKPIEKEKDASTNFSQANTAASPVEPPKQNASQPKTSQQPRKLETSGTTLISNTGPSGKITVTKGTDDASKLKPRDISTRAGAEFELESTTLTESRMPTEQREATWEEFLTGKIAEERIAKKPQYTGSPISLDLRDADILDILRHIGEISGFNVVIDPGVKGTATIHLENVPWDQALDIILTNNGLGKVFEGNIMRVATVEKLRQEAEESRKLLEARAKAKPIMGSIFYFSYADANDAATILREMLSPRGRITVDRRTNSIFIQEIEEGIRDIQRVAKILDKRTRQVSISAKIVQATKTFARSLGINWQAGYTADAAHGNTFKYNFPNSMTMNAAVNLPQTSPILTFGFGDILDSTKVAIALDMAESDGISRIISSPTVITSDNVAATITSGSEIPYPVTGVATVGGATGVAVTGTATTFYEFKQAQISLDVTPHITMDDYISMKVRATNNTPDNSFTPPRINTATASSEVLIKDGDTFVIGSFKQSTFGDSSTRIPWISKVPIIGYLFKNRSISNKFTDLLIFITPRILPEEEITIKAIDLIKQKIEEEKKLGVREESIEEY